MAGRRSKKGSARAAVPPAKAGALAPTSAPAAGRPRRDPRRWIYGGLDLVFGAGYLIALSQLVPGGLAAAGLHLWTLPAGALAMGAGTLLGGRRGWWIAIAAGSALVLSVIAMLARMLLSAALLAGVYGAYGKAASLSLLVAAALIVELVALLPIVQIKYLMTRAGRRAYGV